MRSNATLKSFVKWRNQAREALIARIRPEHYALEGNSLFKKDFKPLSSPTVRFEYKVSKEFLNLAQLVILHRDPQVGAELYQALWRITQEGETQLLMIVTDPLIKKLMARAKEVKKDLHKMHAFLRFLSAEESSYELQAWYEPDHLILEDAQHFFKDRFGNHSWQITTPNEQASWDLSKLKYEIGEFKKPDLVTEDFEELWRSYYKSSFNPSRLNVKKMKLDMPTRFWKNLPEAKDIDSMVQSAKSWLPDKASIEQVLPEFDNLPQLNQMLSQCNRCDLCQKATQSVPGEGGVGTRLFILGEQPGDQEDLAGQPFVGPAGQLLRQHLLSSGLFDESIYLTNAVKHFRFTQDGKRRLHKSPSSYHINSCRPWLQGEYKILQPEFTLALGQSAAQSILGYPIRMSEVRGLWRDGPQKQKVLITYHPSYLLRSPTAQEREQRELDFKNDLIQVKKAMLA